MECALLAVPTTQDQKKISKAIQVNKRRRREAHT